MKPLTICADCGNGIKYSDQAIKRAKSLLLGVYYEGEPICNSCLDKRRKIAMSELNNNSASSATG